jgi:hypothetical protein
MTQHSSLVSAWPFFRAALVSTVVACSAGGCAVYDDSPAYGESHYPYAEPEVVSVYVEPPLYEPAPIAVPWAPPPMMSEMVPPRPFPEAVWVGGYWVWQGRWVWATGRWAPRPRPDYAWVQPYYEHRDGAVLFIPGHWCPPGVAFRPPPPGFRPRMMRPAPGVRPGVAPIGPPGVFLPPPPGSRPGLIVPAPTGTPPSAVRGGPPPMGQGGGPRFRDPDGSPRPPPPAAEAPPPPGAPGGRLFGTVPSPRPAPRQVEEVPPSGRPAWRGHAGQAVPQDAPRDPPRQRGRGFSREQGLSAPRGRDRELESPPPSFQHRPAPAAPVFTAPAPMPSPGAAPGGAPPARHDEGLRRGAGSRGDRDRRDQKSE